MKKLLMGTLLFSGMFTIENAKAHLVAAAMNSTGDTALQGAVIGALTLTGDLDANETTFGTITLNGTMIITDSTVTSISVSNAVIAPADEPVILVASAVSGNITFTGAYGKVILRNGSTIGGSVINGSIVVE